MSDVSSLYNEIEYPGHAFAQTHPDRLATLAVLHGMTPAPVDGCRVLELGCGHGGNLIPLALALPGSRFFGIDLAEKPIAAGKETIAALGLANVELEAGDIMSFGPERGEFDYIITHGVYAWTPEPVRDQVMRISKQNLAPNGVAFISYNAMPGGHIRQIIRDMMLFHTRQIEDHQERLEQGMAIVQFASSALGRQDEFQQLLKKEIEGLYEKALPAVFHDEMGEVYAPVYFHEFATHAARHGLQYLSEANLFDMQDSVLTEQGRASLAKASGGSILLREQYLDFAKCRRFRQTLVCHEDVQLDRSMPAERLRGLYFATQARALSEEPDLTDGVVEDFEGPLNSAMKTAHAGAKTALACLIAVWPQAISFADLAGSVPGTREDLTEILMAAAKAGLVELHVAPRTLVTRPGAKPVASPLARYQAIRGMPMTTLVHATAKVGGELERKLVTLLDGTRDRAALIQEIAPLVEMADRGEIAKGLEASLVRLGRLGLLMS